MRRSPSRRLLSALLGAVTACGVAQSDAASTPRGEAFPSPDFRPISFTGVAEPATGRLQLFMGPQAALSQIPESADGNALSVGSGTVQVYAPTVSFISNNSLYPAGCNTGSPMLMQADVEVLSGYAEQLRNVYANVSDQSSGPTFCATNSLGSFASTVGTTVGAYLYQPLDRGASPSLDKRSVRWSMNLPDNSPYWFTGNVWAEVIPQPPTGLTPADDATYGPLWFFQFSWVTLRWTDDPLADGTNPEGFVVARPTGGASLTILQCGPSSAPFDAQTCSSTFQAPTQVNNGRYSGTFPLGYWYQWSVRTSFLLPGASSRTLGSVVATRHFATSP